MIRRRRFRRKSSWIWADRFNITLNNASPAFAGASSAGHLLLPPGRVNWFCDTQVRRSHVTVTGILLWLDFWWQSDIASDTTIPDVDFFLIASTEDEAGSIATQFDPFVEPQLPAAVTDWTFAPSDGLDPFMWTHHIKGSTPPNAFVSQTSSNNQYNQSFVMHAASDAQEATCRKFMVAAEWQPDIHVKTRRRLVKDQGLWLGMRALTAALPSGMQAMLDVRTRIVAR